MTDAKPEIPEAEVRTGRNRWALLVWLIPLAAIGFFGWTVYTAYFDSFVITIDFEAAEGVSEGRTKLKYKDVEIGTVRAVRLQQLPADTFAGHACEHNKMGTAPQAKIDAVRLEIDLDRRYKKFLRTDAEFEIVRPRVTANEITGLDTIVAGPYIELHAGAAEKLGRKFIGARDPVLKRAGASKHLEILLTTSRLGSLTAGSPILYHQLEIGRVTRVCHDTSAVASDAPPIALHASILDKYRQLVGPHSRFWNASGVDLDLSADGFRVHVESLDALLVGALALNNPDTGPGTTALPVFEVHTTLKAARDSRYAGDIQQFELVFSENQRGLHSEAPVEFRGQRVGAVRTVELLWDNSNERLYTSVSLDLETERVIDRGGESPIPTTHWVEQLHTDPNDTEGNALRARLEGNLLTGAMYVVLDYYEDPLPQFSRDDFRTGRGLLPRIATMPSFTEGTKRDIERILANFSQFDIENISDQIKQALATINDADSGTLVQVRRAVARIEEFVDETTGVVSEDAETIERANQLMQEATEAARALRNFLNLLESDPNAVIFGK